MFEPIHRPEFTMRYIPGNVETQKDVWDAIYEGAIQAYASLELGQNHLFITVVGTEVFTTGPKDKDYAFAMYHQGIQHVAVAGGEPPKEFEGVRNDWLIEMQVTTIHEMVHFYQDLCGTLEGSEANELEADELARKIVNTEVW